MRMAWLALLAGPFGLTACGQQPAASPRQQAAAQSQPDDTTPTSVHGLMTGRVDPYADIIWGIGNDAMNDDAGIDPAKMSPASWRELGLTASKLAAAARALQALQPLRATVAGERIVDDGKPQAPTAVHVQQHLDADPARFRSLAASLERHGRDLAAAAAARDARTAGRLVNEIDEVCEACHLQFWYPEDRKILDAIARQK